MTDTTPDELRARAVFEFLSGAEQLDGLWFGDHKPGKKGAFWWRTDLHAVSTALLDRIAAQDAEIARLKAGLSKLANEAEAQLCQHEDTHRGGTIWTICDDCGRKWADDEGGFNPYETPAYILAARATLTGETE